MLLRWSGELTPTVLALQVGDWIYQALSAIISNGLLGLIDHVLEGAHVIHAGRYQGTRFVEIMLKVWIIIV